MVKGHSVLFATRGAQVETGEKAQGWALPRSCDLCSHYSPSHCHGRHLTDQLPGRHKGRNPQPVSNPCLAFPFDGHCSRANCGPGVPVHLPFRRNDPHCHVWLTPFCASPLVMMLLIIQDPAQISPSPSERPCPHLPLLCYYQRAS